MKRSRFPVIVLRPQSRGGEHAGVWRRRISTLGHIPRDTIVLLLVIVRLTTAACADDIPTPTRAPTPQPPMHEDSMEATDGTSMDLGVISSVIQASLSFLQPRTLESHDIHDFALWGLNGLSALDPSLSIEEQHGFLQLAATQKTVLALPVPAADDIAGWSSAITRILDVAWHHSPAMRSTGQDGVLQGFFDELFNHLDPYSRYVPPGAAVSDRSIRTGGEATAGLTLGQDRHAIIITAVNANGPAWPTSLAAGQIVRAINGRATASRTLETVASWLNGPTGSLVRITVESKGRQSTVTLHRASTPPETVFAYTSGKHVVLHITAFSANTAEEMSQYLDEAMNVPGISGLIIDLRGNRGGVLQQAVTTSALMLDHGVAAITQGRDPQANHVWAVQGGDMTNGLPIIVLVDGRTASAAEILAAALADQKRGVVIGSATLGKGLVQTIGQMPNGAELFVTWSRVLAPLGWPLQGLGVMPQVCTSLGESELERQLQNLAEGSADSREWVAAARQIRYPVDLSRILTIRKACPAAIGTDSDLDAAHSLLDNPVEYHAALSTIPEEGAAPANGG
ncbi:S41 family peptidase [Komagataeibacter oboediens]|uniref:PDZ domain-containing protein n=1 Tax=Komagataeibacter oboediens TaxID=65958 RepID=A0ABS5SQ30_9PROT|nr:S41 family peptidase [Komagataeibacter oboediens]MBL7232727.1 PDZ domain-containing protein [Komagataeibacter oboediens]MBT0676294.1 PDZ domain-containing protein [Komagataeibacter oboediens]MBT0679481.1 PDZ domain-containing protein [Komagataeibacter oboediens]